MTTPRPPTRSDFSDQIHVDIIPSSSTTVVNVLILLHGLGDTSTPFAAFAKGINLPETCCIAVRGIAPVPEIFTGESRPSFHWGEDVVFDSNSGELQQDAAFGRASHLIKDEIVTPLVDQCHFPLRNIFLFGYGQGGMAALSIANLYADAELGGITTIGGPLPAEVATPSSSKLATPSLVCGGHRQTSITQNVLQRLREVFASVEYVKWDRGGDGMPGDRAEMLPLMRFWARRLKSRAGVPLGAVEL